MKEYAEYRASGRRVQLSALRSATAATALAADQPLYQLTLDASKNNAFCWLSWESQIDWRAKSKEQLEAQASRNRIVEEKRSAGIDPLHISGLRKKIAVDPMRFSVMSWAKKA